MIKIIKIDGCTECPHCVYSTSDSHATDESYGLYCRHDEQENTSVYIGKRGRSSAIVFGCPLEDYEEKDEVD